MIYRDEWVESFRWHRWFAWYPVTIGRDRYWLEQVRRRRRQPCLELRVAGGPMVAGITWWEYEPPVPKPVPYMVFGGTEPRSPQENANDAWAALGTEMGFKPMTVEPSHKGNRFFSAEPQAVIYPLTDVIYYYVDRHGSIDPIDTWSQDDLHKLIKAARAELKRRKPSALLDRSAQKGESSG